MVEKVPVTIAGYAALNEELKDLKSTQRPAVIRAISEAREHGDLSENAEYHTARERQSFIEGRIKELESLIARADVIDPAKLNGSSIKFGATITVADEDTDEEKTYQIVGETEADIAAGKLNIRSPLARALIGKEAGDSVEVMTPGGGKSYEVLSVAFE
ncbi:transcription elongation factor GreA [Pikeienuella sp. HZG-20]|uniref:transcription elongation factor GreA n=1 Tax=Paludibacillus litoralis TaxID=3133267 RepID=UPI0030EF0E3D